MPHPHPLAYPAGRHVPARDLEEAKFWFAIMREHALLMKTGLPAQPAALSSEADDFYGRFGELLKKANAAPGEKKYKALLDDGVKQAGAFYRFNRRLVRQAMTGRLHGYLFPLLLDHMSREALYTLSMLERLADGKPTYYKVSVTGEMLFWLRLMGDHAKLIRQMLDPSETGLLAAAGDFSGEFDALYLQARDFASMLGSQGGIPAYDRFILDVRAAAIRLRDFKRALCAMLAEGRMLGLLSIMMIEHMRDEVEHFLMVLTLMEKGQIECVTEEAGFDLTGEQILVDDEIESLPETKPVFCPPPEERPEEREEERLPEEAAPEVPVAEVAPEPVPVEEAPPAKSKFKWGAKWPRPLGKAAE